MDVSDLELIDRYQTLFEKFVEMSPKLATMLDDFAKVKKELQVLIVELHKRKLPTTHPGYEEPPDEKPASR